MIDLLAIVGSMVFVGAVCFALVWAEGENKKIGGKE